MMKRIGYDSKTKLKSNSGVTILFALLFFLIAAVVSILIVSNAASSVKRTHSTQQSIQDNATLDSAALLLKDNIDGAEFILTTNGDTANESWNDADMYAMFASEIRTISTSYIQGDSAPSGTFTIDSKYSNAYDSTVTVSYKSTYLDDRDKQIASFKLSIDDTNVTYLTFNIVKTSEQNKNSVRWSIDNVSGRDDYDVFE